MTLQLYRGRELGRDGDSMVRSALLVTHGRRTYLSLIDVDMLDPISI